MTTRVARLTNALTRLFFLGVTLIILAACGGVDLDTPGETVIDIPSLQPGDATATSPAFALPHTKTPEKPVPSTISTVTETPTSAPTARTQYILTAILDYAGHHLSVEEEIAYTNRTSEPIIDMLLIVEPSRYPGVFHLNRLTLGDSQPLTDYDREVGFIRIPLPEPLDPGEIINLSLSYELNLPSPDPAYYGRPVPFGYSTRQTNLVDWYPFLPPYMNGEDTQSPLAGQEVSEDLREGGWLAHQAGFFGEHLVYESADFEVHLRLVDARPELVVAASAPAQVDGEWRRYRHDVARNFAFSVSDQYELSTKTVDGVMVLGYAFPFDSAAGEAALQATAESLALYNDLFGRYPRPSLSVVEADFLDGMEYDGLYFLSKGFYSSYSSAPSDYLIAIAAHETAHQWWYARVGNDQALEPWLDEALSTYSERLYYENLSPESLDWWWTYRVEYFEPQGWVDGSIYNPEGYRAYRDAVYLNGAVFLETLREAIGEEAFFTLLKSFYERYSGAIATGEDFFALLRESDQADLTDLLDRFFRQQ